MNIRSLGMAMVAIWAAAWCASGLAQPAQGRELSAVVTQREVERRRDEGDVRGLVHLLTSTDATAVGLAAQALGSCGDETVLPLLEDPGVAGRISDPWQRQWTLAACAVAARRVAARMRGADDISTLIEVVRDTGNAAERLEAARILQDLDALGPAYAEAALEAAQGEWLEADGAGGEARALFLLASAKTNNPELLPLLRRTVERGAGRPWLNLLVEAYWGLRLQGLDEDEGVAALIAALTDDPVMRPAWVLRSYKDAAAAPLAAFIAEPGRTDNELLSALWALWQIPAPSAGATLAAILRDKDRPDDVRTAAALALSTCGAQESVGWLREALDAGDAGSFATGAILTALGQLGAREHAVRVAEFLNHEDARLRRHAAEALRPMGARDQYEAVRLRLEVETDEDVRYLLEQALAALRPEANEP